MHLRELKIKSNQNALSINDLRELYFNGVKLSSKQQLAIRNFDKYRLVELEKVKEKPHFHQVYFKIQAMANLTDFSEFLDLENLIK